MKALTMPLEELAEFEEIKKEQKKGKGVLQLSGCVRSQKTHLVYALSGGSKRRVIVCASESKAKQVYEEYRFLDSDVWFYPAKDFLFYQADIRSKELMSQRMSVIQAVLEQEKVTVVLSFDALMDALPVPRTVRGQAISIENGAAIDFQQVQRRLAQAGYDRESQVEGPGQFAVRGGILDIFPITEELPVRIELWGDEVDSVRTFDVESQRSVENLEQVLVYPCEEAEKEGERVSFLDYFSAEDTILYLDEPVRLLEKGEAVESEFVEAQARRMESGYQVSDEEMLLYHARDIAKKMNRYSCVGLCALEARCPDLKIRGKYSLETKSVNPYNNSFEMLTRDLKRLKREGYRVVLLSGSRTRAKRLAEDLRDYNLSGADHDRLRPRSGGIRVSPAEV